MYHENFHLKKTRSLEIFEQQSERIQFTKKVLLRVIKLKIVFLLKGFHL